MTELTYAALRQIMYQPTAVWLATENSGDRWLHDQWVMLNVTDHPALTKSCWMSCDPDCEIGSAHCWNHHRPSHKPDWHDWNSCNDPELPDGAYKLMADPDKGLQPRDSIPPADLEAWFRGAEGTWVPASPSEWSVAEHPGKAMLWVAQGKPCLLGENTWTAIKRHYPEAWVEYLASRNLFRFSAFEPRIEPDPDAPGYNRGRWALPFCFAAGIQVPTGQEGIALAIADLHPYLDSTRNHAYPRI